MPKALISKDVAEDLEAVDLLKIRLGWDLLHPIVFTQDLRVTTNRISCCAHEDGFYQDCLKVLKKSTYVGDGAARVLHEIEATCIPQGWVKVLSNHPFLRFLMDQTKGPILQWVPDQSRWEPVELRVSIP